MRRALPGADDVSGAEVLVVAPAVNESPVRFWMSDADDAIARAGETAGETAGELRSEGAQARARTGEGEPLMALQSMVTRTDYKGRVWGANQRVTMDEALRIATINGSRASYEEAQKGSIVAGKFTRYFSAQL